MGLDATDCSFMDQALDLAVEAYGLTSPNPLVGAVVVREGTAIGIGYHRRAGEPHAEPQALEAARRHVTDPTSAKDWTLYVNLEPCVHQGRTPPCIDAILAAPVGRVVVAHVDPDPRVAGRGIARLRDAGIEVEVGCLGTEAAELNHVFIARQHRRRPYVALKVALSADGCIAGVEGERVAVTGDGALLHAHGLRAELDAIMVGVETLRRDRPRLDRRLHLGPGSTPRRLVVDPDLRSDPEWLWPGESPGVLFCRRSALEARGARLAEVAQLVALPEREDRLDLEALLAGLGDLGLWSVLVEGGGRTHRAFLEQGLWDRMYVYRNPTLQLGGLPWAAAPAWSAATGDLTPHRKLTLGHDELDVFVNPASLPRS
jgi:diaminohydroxyphosphoribosylaminopyrimidine deaminase/5-amino-6-(5-phosphoribosylamino)uracil reductase